MSVLTFPLRRWAFGVGLVACLAAGGAARADDAIPKPFAPGQFTKLANHSPFSPPTQTAAVAQPTAVAGPKPFEKYSVTSLMQQGDGYVATLNNKETSEHSRVRSDAENGDGLTLASVEWSKDPAQTKVTLRKGTEFGVVSFDPASTANASATTPGAVRPGMAGRPIPPATAFRPPPGVAPGAAGPSAVQATGSNSVRRQPLIYSPPPPVRAPPVPRPPAPNFGNSPRAVPPPIPGAPPASATPDPDDDDT